VSARTWRISSSRCSGPGCLLCRGRSCPTTARILLRCRRRRYRICRARPPGATPSTAGTRRRKSASSRGSSARRAASGADERPPAWSTSLQSSISGSMRLYEQAFGMAMLDEDGRPLLDERQSVAGGLGNVAVAATLFKANLGTNILYMPHAFNQGGYVVGLAFLVSLAFLSVICVARLTQCKTGSKESYGDIMERATGATGRGAVNFCIVLLQVGTCCCYLVNVANMVGESFLPHVDRRILILVQGVVVAPLVLIRNVAKLSPITVFGGVMTILGIALTFGAIGARLGSDGVSDVEPFRPQGLLVCLGIACFTFEGIGLAIPVFESARHPHKFVAVYSMTITGILVLIVGMSGLGYFAFGSATDTLVLINLDKGVLSDTIRIMFSLVMLLSFPLQMLPAIRIVESLFLQPSRPHTCDKHLKSAFRVFFIALVAGVSIFASTSLANFVSLVGAVCGLPLAFIFPAICHRRLVAVRGSCAAFSDLGFIFFGLLVTLVVGVENCANWGK